MKRLIVYFSASGNSLWTARILGEGLGDCELMHITDASILDKISTTEALGFVFPVHIWGIPKAVVDLIETVEFSPGLYLFAVAVNAGQVSRTLIQLAELIRKRGGHLSAAIGVELPSNYTPWGGPGSVSEIEQRIVDSQVKLSHFAALVARGESSPVERGPLWQRIVFTALYHLTLNRLPAMDSRFAVDPGCDRCGICRRVCPVDNIELSDVGPIWRHRCTQCLACLHWCPKTVIQFGPKTHRFPRYHHPAVVLRDLVRR